MATQQFPEANLQNRESLSKLQAKTIDFVYRFQKDMRDFVNVLGLMNETPVTEGYTIKTKIADTKVDLKDGNVAEGDLIPLSKVEFKEGASFELSTKKWRAAATYEAIQKYGYENAVDRADNEILERIRADIRKEMFEFLKTSAKTQATVKSGSLQGAVATAWGYLEGLFESANETVVFAHPMDVAKYLGEASITMQTAFGVSYLNAFSNTKIIVSNFVEQGTILATVPKNITLFYIPANSEGGRAFGMVSDQSGYIGLTRKEDLRNATINSLFTSGIKLAPEVENGIVKVEIGEDTPTV